MILRLFVLCAGNFLPLFFLISLTPRDRPLVWSFFPSGCIEEQLSAEQSGWYYYYSPFPFIQMQHGQYVGRAVVYAWTVSDTRDFQLNINYAANCQLIHDLSSVLTVLCQRTLKRADLHLSGFKWLNSWQNELLGNNASHLNYEYWTFICSVCPYECVCVCLHRCIYKWVGVSKCVCMCTHLL